MTATDSISDEPELARQYQTPAAIPATSKTAIAANQYLRPEAPTGAARATPEAEEGCTATASWAAEEEAAVATGVDPDGYVTIDAGLPASRPMAELLPDSIS